MTTTGPSTLRERIAALQQRGTSPQPTSPPRSQTPTGGSGNVAGGTALRDKIARFEQKGGTPIPRGSFGLGAPPQATGRRNNELWGNRIPSAGRPPGAGTSSADRTSSLSVESPGRQRRVSMADAQLGAMGRLKEPIALDTSRGSDMIQSLDIARHTPTSPTFSAKLPSSPARKSSALDAFNGISTPHHEPGSKSIAPPSPSTSPPPPIIVVEEKDVRGPPEASLGDDPPELEVNADASTILDTTLEGDVIGNSLTSTRSVIVLDTRSSPFPAYSNDTRSLTPVQEDMVYELSMPIVVPKDESSTSEIPKEVEELQPSLESPDDASNSGSPPVSSDSSHQNASVTTSGAHDLGPHVEEDTVVPAINTPSSLGTAMSPSQSPTGDRIPSALLVAADTRPEESVSYGQGSLPRLGDASEPDGTMTPNRPKALSPPAEQRTPISLSSRVLEIPPALQTLNAPDFPHSPTVTSRSDARLSTASSLSEASCDSPPRVTPILDAFPAVPRFVPSSTLPARARTISGRPNRMSASSMSSTKSTPSLSFSSNSSSTSSPTLAEVAAPLRPPDTRRLASGLQRSKSQTTRPISSVPAWYDDDSDDGEAGWANVIVTTRRY